MTPAPNRVPVTVLLPRILHARLQQRDRDVRTEIIRILERALADPLPRPTLPPEHDG